MWPKELFTHTFMVTVKILISIIDIVGKYEVLLSVEMGHEFPQARVTFRVSKSF